MNDIFLPPPSAIVPRAVQLVVSGELNAHLAASLRSLALGVVLANLVGITLAVMSACWQTFRFVLAPLVELTRGLAPIALLPAFLLLFGIGSRSTVAIMVWVAWVPIFVNTLEGIDNVPPTLVRAARSMSASTIKILRAVVCPATFPYYIAGLRLAVGSAFLALVAAEMLGSRAGLGFFILESSQTFRILDMYGAIAVVAVLGVVINLALVAIAARLLRWRP